VKTSGYNKIGRRMRDRDYEEDAKRAVDIVILTRKSRAYRTCAALAVVASVGLCGAMSGCKSDTSRAETVESSPIATETSVAKSMDDAGSADTRPVIACFGDSLTAGYGTDPGQSYPDALQKLLDAQGYHYHVVNAGVSGETTKDGLERVGRVVGRHPKIVVLEFGGNDGLRGLPLEQTESNLSAMIAALQKGGAEVALAGITLPPEYGPDYIAKINAIYPALAKKYHVRLLPFLLKDVYGVPGDMQEDGHHATAQGNQGVAVTVEKLLQPMLRR
jgi:acyl-CoA thioesterase I